MKKLREHYFNCVHIIESLSKGDLKTGTNIYEQVIYPETFNKDNLKGYLHEPETAKDLNSTLEEIYYNTKNKGELPIIQIDAHGRKEGIETSSGEFLKWKDMKNILVKINEATELNLFVVLSACSGSYLSGIISPVDRAPVWGLIGPKKTISSGVLEDSLKAFYRELFNSLNGNKAIEKLKRECPDFKFYSAEVLYILAFKKYFNDYCSKEDIKGRENDIVEKLKGQVQWGEQEVRKYVKERLSDQEDFFNKFLKRFFMIDLYPQNRERFSLSFNEIKL